MEHYQMLLTFMLIGTFERDPIKNIWKNNGEISPNLWQNSIKHRVIVRNSKTKGLKTKKSATTEL